jgi:hypothetical protein
LFFHEVRGPAGSSERWDLRQKRVWRSLLGGVPVLSSSGKAGTSKKLKMKDRTVGRSTDELRVPTAFLEEPYAMYMCYMVKCYVRMSRVLCGA